MQSKMFRTILFLEKYFLPLLFCLLCAPASATEEAMTAEELDSWFEQDELTSTDKISEGELRFLLEWPSKPVLHSLNRLTILEQSLDDGWVVLSQCYQNLDPVAESEVVYEYKSMRDLQVTSYKNIEVTSIEGQSIQLLNVQRNAELCITAMVRIFYQNPDGNYSLVNGPFHRKFLDGYYPYHLTLAVDYPKSRLKLVHTTPADQAGFSVKEQNGELLLDGLFEGILNVEIVFIPLETSR